MVYGVDWNGWVFPVPIWEGRTPVVTQEWKPGGDPVFGQASGAFSNHAGVDIMFRKLPTDPPGNIPHDAEGPYIAPEGTPIIASGPGKVWATGGEPHFGNWILIDHGQVMTADGRAVGLNTWYQHLASYERNWKQGDDVGPGTILGRMGYAPGDPGGLRHLHFETRWFDPGESRLDPSPYLDQWPKTQVSRVGSLLSRLWNSLGSLGPVPIAPVLAGALAYWKWRR